MRLIDENAVRDVIYGMHVDGEEGVENALRNTYGADLREILYEIYELPTVCDIDAIKKRIKYEANVLDTTKGFAYCSGWMDAFKFALDIIDEYTKGDTDV